jgi:hypothetical protein
VCDTTVLLYLGRIGQAGLLPELFAPVFIPEPILLELDMGRILRHDTINPREVTLCFPVPHLDLNHQPSRWAQLGLYHVSAIGVRRRLFQGDGESRQSTNQESIKTVPPAMSQKSVK